MAAGEAGEPGGAGKGGTDDCGRHGPVRSAHVGWSHPLVAHPRGKGLPGVEREDRVPAHALRTRPPVWVPDAVREVARRTCTAGWQDAVAWRLSGALDQAGWSTLRSRPAGLCRLLAAVAREVECTSVLLGEAAGLGTVEGPRWRGRTRLVQKIAQAAVQKAVPAPGESRPRVVAHCLVVTGVWLCVSGGVTSACALRVCACFETLAGGRSVESVRADLERHLTCLRAAPRV